MRNRRSDRRDFLIGTLASLVALPAITEADSIQSKELAQSYIELPPKTTLWGVAAFFGPDPVEIAVVTAKQSKSVTGRFRKQRLVEHSWRNSSDKAEKVNIRAQASRLDGNVQPLEPTGVRFVGEQNCYIGFGRRYPSVNVSEREGAYPYEAVFVGFILFGDQ
jgi:hypothetical protein